MFSSKQEFLDEHDEAREEQSRGHKAAEQKDDRVHVRYSLDPADEGQDPDDGH